MPSKAMDVEARERVYWAKNEEKKKQKEKKLREARDVCMYYA